MDISEDEHDDDDGDNNSDDRDIDTDELNTKEGKSLKKDKFAEYGFNLPPEPKGKCPPELQEKITHLYEKMKDGLDMNRVIQDKKEFRNPSIYDKLIQFCDINELGTNYPPEIYDPLQWGKYFLLTKVIIGFFFFIFLIYRQRIIL